MYDAWGLRLASPLPLTLPLADEGAAPTAPADVEVHLEAPRVIPFQRPSEDLVAEYRTPTVAYYSICRLADGSTVARFYNLAEFRISATGTEVSCAIRPGVDQEYLAILLSGTIAAYLHACAGATVLHASVVESGGRALAFLGPSNGGKSTLAAVLCGVGARLVTDDVLVVGDVGGVAAAARGSTALRLRPGSTSLAEGLPAGTPRRRTIDDRLDVTPPAVTERATPLAALALVELSDQPDLAVRRLAPAAGSLALTAVLRIEGWRPPEVVRRHFTSLADLADGVPVLTLRVPRGAHRRPGFAAAVADGCSFSLP